MIHVKLLDRCALLLSGLMLLPMMPGDAWAGSPVDRMSPRPVETEQQAAPRDRRAEREVELMMNSCTSSYLARAVMVRPGCSTYMKAVVDLGEQAVPVLAEQVLAEARQHAERPPIDNRGHLLVGALRRIGGKAGTDALLKLSGQPAVQAAQGGIFESVHLALGQLTSAKIELREHSPAARAAAAAAWKAHLAAAANVPQG